MLTLDRQKIPRTFVFILALPILYGFGMRLFGGQAPDTTTLVAIVGALAGLGLFANGFRRERLRRRIQALPTSKVRSMAMGTVELAGSAMELEPLLDPIYGEPCVFFSIRVQEQRRTGKRSHWATVYRKDSADKPFYLRDETGQVLIMPKGGEVHGGLTLKRWRSGLIGSATDAATDFMNRHVSRWRSGRLDATIIRPVMPVYVLGYAATLPRAYDEAAGVAEAEAARKLKGDAAKMAALDANGDGRIDSFEWDAGLFKYKKELDAALRAEKLLKDPNRDQLHTARAIVVDAPAQSLIIADDEAKLLGRLGWAAIAQIVAGPFVFAGSVAYLAGLWG